MGYTHYWRFEGASKINKKAWTKICDDARRLIAVSPVGLAFEEGSNEPPVIDDDQIRFNGAVDPEGHETFLLDRCDPGFNFCKTARKRYDHVVVGILAAAAEHSPHLSVRSDGDEPDWRPALDWASAVLGRPLPFPVKDND